MEEELERLMRPVLQLMVPLHQSMVVDWQLLVEQLV